MGYTHYFKIDYDKVPPEAFGRWALDVKRIIEATDVPIGDNFGEKVDAWEIAEGHVSFNGVGDDSHETFYVSAPGIEEEYVSWFCKTARKDYDAVVVAALIRLKHYYGDAVDLSSDGNTEADFVRGVALYKETFLEEVDAVEVFRGKRAA